MQTTIQNAAHMAVQAEPCANCRDNFILRDLHGPLDVFDGPAVHGQIERRRACTACPETDKPCMKPAAVTDPTLNGNALAELVLQAQDETESLRTVLRACHAVAALAVGVTHPHATVSMDGLGELLHLHSNAMGQCLDAIGTRIDTLRMASTAREPGDRARRLALDASDQVTHMCQAHHAFEAVACLVPSVADTLTGENLGAALRLLADAMDERTASMDDMLDALHAALTAAPVQEGKSA